VPPSLGGLPLHPLLVHATVVIVPAAALSVLLAALWPRFRRWAGLLPVGLAVFGLILDPLSTSTGESLENQVGRSALVEKHAELADGLLPWLIGLVVMAAALHAWHWRLSRRNSGEQASARAWVPMLIAALAVVAALGTSVQVVLIGHSGAKAAWSGVANQSAASRQ
jgi:predicted membrane protein DUF2231